MSTSDVDGLCENLEGCKLDAEKKISDEELFKQPPLEDCPICFLRMPLFNTGIKYRSCCGKMICSGCCFAPVYDDRGNKVDNQKCPFCRAPHPRTEEEAVEMLMGRFEVNDPLAIYNHGNYCRDGKCGYSQDYKKALELWHRAAELGYAVAYNNIGYAYYNGKGVKVDKEKAGYYYELSAMGGNVRARYNLGAKEEEQGNKDRALKHHMVAARSGLSESVKKIQMLYSDGHVTKDDYMKALRLYQEYLSEIKSVQRDKAAAYSDRFRYY